MGLKSLAAITILSSVGKRVIKRKTKNKVEQVKEDLSNKVEDTKFAAQTLIAKVTGQPLPEKKEPEPIPEPIPEPSLVKKGTTGLFNHINNAAGALNKGLDKVSSENTEKPKKPVKKSKKRKLKK